MDQESYQYTSPEVKRQGFIDHHMQTVRAFGTLARHSEAVASIVDQQHKEICELQERAAGLQRDLGCCALVSVGRMPKKEREPHLQFLGKSHSEDKAEELCQEAQSVHTLWEMKEALHDKLDIQVRANKMNVDNLIKQNDSQVTKINKLEDDLAEVTTNEEVLRIKLDQRNGSYAILEETVKVLEAELEEAKREIKRLKRTHLPKVTTRTRRVE